MTRILCDFDGRLPRDLTARLSFVARALELRVAYYRIDKTRHGFHVIVECGARLSPVEIVLTQTLLGSDWKRETFNARRVRLLKQYPRFWGKRWNVLYGTHTRNVALTRKTAACA